MWGASSGRGALRGRAHAAAVIAVLATQLGCAGRRVPAELQPAMPGAPPRLDVRGKTITTYILFEATRRLRTMRDGEVLEIVASPFAAIEPDIRAWCRMTGQILREPTRSEGFTRYFIEKAPWHTQAKRVAMVISDPGLEELLAPLGFALAAALTGAEVHLYFQGPGVHVLERGFQARLRGTFRSLFSGFARDGLAEIGHLPPEQKLKQLHDLGAHLYACGPSLEHFGVDPASFAYDDVMVAEYLTFLEQMRNADVALLLQ